MKFNIDDYQGKYAMHCKTEEEARDFCNLLDSIGLHWSNGGSYAEETRYSVYKEKTCYGFNKGLFGVKSSFENYCYTILEWSDFVNRKFTKSDLKNGDVTLRRDGRVSIACIETGTLISPDGFDYLDVVSEDLTDIQFLDTDFDIVAVRRPKKPSDCQFCAFGEKLGELVYERKEVEEMTLEEVCEALGKKIKIVESKG